MPLYLAGYNEHGPEQLFFSLWLSLLQSTMWNVVQNTVYFFCYKINTRSKYSPPLTKLRVSLIRSSKVHEIIPIKCWSMTSRFVEKGLRFNRFTPNDPYMGRTAPLTSKRCILYIYSTNIGTEYFKRALDPPFFLFKMQFVS